MNVSEIRPGLWRWTARHPDWTPEEGGSDGWEPEVASYAVAAADALVLIDPLVPVDEEGQFWRALDDDVRRHGPPRILLTVFWHARSSQRILDRYEGARVLAPAAWADRARERVPSAETYELGDALPGGIEAKGTVYRGEALLWIPKHRALVAGDILLGTPGGGVRVCPDSWLADGVTPQQLREGLRPILDLPVELLLLTHGDPILADGRDALATALS